MHLIFFLYQVNKKLNDRTALHCAAAQGNTKLVKLLLECGAGANIKVCEVVYGNTHYPLEPSALHIYVHMDDLASIKFINSKCFVACNEQVRLKFS